MSGTRCPQSEEGVVRRSLKKRAEPTRQLILRLKVPARKNRGVQPPISLRAHLLPR